MVHAIDRVDPTGEIVSKLTGPAPGSGSYVATFWLKVPLSSGNANAFTTCSRRWYNRKNTIAPGKLFWAGSSQRYHLSAHGCSAYNYDYRKSEWKLCYSARWAFPDN